MTVVQTGRLTRRRMLLQILKRWAECQIQYHRQVAFLTSTDFHDIDDGLLLCRPDLGLSERPRELIVRTD